MIWGGDNMAGNVKVLTNDLINDGIYVKNVCDNIKDNYDNVNNVISDVCLTLNYYKEQLSLKFEVFQEHSNIFNDKINNCALDLEKIDNLIGSNVTNLLGNADNFEFGDNNYYELSTITLKTNDGINIDIGNLADLPDNERKTVLNKFYKELGTAVVNIENGNYTYPGTSDNDLVNSLVRQYYDSIVKIDASGNVIYESNDLTKNNFYNSVVKKYGEIANVQITPKDLHYASRNGNPLIRENIQEYNLQFAVQQTPTEIGQEYDFCRWGLVNGDEKTSDYSKQLYEETGSYQRVYSYYPDDSEHRHMFIDQFYLCDDGIYRDKDGYIICADKYNLGYNEDGTSHWVGQINSENAVIVDTPFGFGKVYDSCGQGNIDIYTHF